jgi:hypothetical protein
LLKNDYEKIKKQVQNATLDVQFNSSEFLSNRLIFKGKKNEVFFICKQCSKRFLCKKGLDNHESVHDKSYSQLDDIQIKYYEKCSDIRTKNSNDENKAKKSSETNRSITSEPLAQGFAIKSRKMKRFTQEQKEYLTDLFNKGESDKKNKARPIAVEADMINRFSEGLNERQISSFFSRLSSDKKKQKVTENQNSKVVKKKKLNEKEINENTSDLNELNDDFDKTVELSNKYSLRKRLTKKIIQEIDSDADDIFE